MRLLSSGDVCEIVGMKHSTFDEWCSKGVVVPVEGGQGHGDHLRFFMMQAVGIVLALELHASKRRRALAYAGQVKVAGWLCGS
ncbi:MAG: hypothetical protein JXM70_14960 [Pirellulales bacterium]|nr:hypothetical protein [Pirellulales bacterium]